jgi:hypothetical protein
MRVENKVSRRRATLHAIKAKLRQQMLGPVNQVDIWSKRVVSGYYRCHAVPENRSALSRFRDRLMAPPLRSPLANCLRFGSSLSVTDASWRRAFN